MSVSTYTVRPGETLPRIAREHQTTVAELLRLNPQVARNTVVPGTVLRLNEDSFSANAAGAAGTSPAPTNAPLPSMSLGQTQHLSPADLPVHFQGPTTFEGAKVTASALQSYYQNVTAEKFGTTDVQLPQPDGSVKTENVRDMHYRLPNGSIGMNLVPVSDSGSVKRADGTSASGGALMDELLRKEMGLGADDPIYAFASYIHPEDHSGDLKQLGGEMMKTEMGTTHLGAYLGNGRTTNSPENYHHNKWEVRGYPANVSVMSMDGVPQKTLNQNLRLADSILNQGVKFPGDYKKDIFRTSDLNTTLQFYRDWINDEPYLKNENSWFTYCAEHKTIVANIGLNVPHNLESFKEIFGADGEALWEKFKTKFESANGRAFTAKDETKFEPLWKKEGLTPEQIRPMSKAEWDKYQAARFDGSLADGSYTGFRPLPPGKGMAWAPETTADLVQDFLESYVPFHRVGGFPAAAAMLGFKDTIKERMGLTDEQCLALALPVINKLMIAEAAARGPDTEAGLAQWAEKAKGMLYVAYGGKPQDLAPGGTVDTLRMNLADQSLQGVKRSIPQVRALQAGGPAERAENATKWLRDSISEDVDKARKQAVSDPSKIEFYSPPAVIHRVATGMHESNPLVHVRTVATAVDSSELEGQA